MINEIFKLFWANTKRMDDKRIKTLTILVIISPFFTGISNIDKCTVGQEAGGHLFDDFTNQLAVFARRKLNVVIFPYSYRNHVFPALISILECKCRLISEKLREQRVKMNRVVGTYNF